MHITQQQFIDVEELSSTVIIRRSSVEFNNKGEARPNNPVLVAVIEPSMLYDTVRKAGLHRTSLARQRASTISMTLESVFSIIHIIKRISASTPCLLI